MAASEEPDDSLAIALADFRIANDDGSRYSFDEVLTMFGLTQNALNETEDS